ncbi:TIGR02391 family protein [Kribbella voronezhensis]|uniref:TIGR02391 family protein n=1 Tax=Kribbella voronezhensis TaxID=2512212 RepID=UPI0014170ED0|nr:TIGR02391 family protein [Kribbella voronezhensis]
MNYEWMRERLETFEKVLLAYDNRDLRADSSKEIGAAISTTLPTIRQIVKQLDPALPPRITEPQAYVGVHPTLRAVREALGILRDQELWALNLAPEAPSLVADQFHPHVWPAASALWDTGQYRVAVGQAAVSLSAHIAQKAASPLTERELVAQLFSPAEPTGHQVRLHYPGDRTSKTWRSRQEGLHLLAQGAFAGIRNVATHTDDEWTEQVGLEHVAVLSVVARWADETEVVRP